MSPETSDPRLSSPSARCTEHSCECGVLSVNSDLYYNIKSGCSRVATTLLPCTHERQHEYDSHTALRAHITRHKAHMRSVCLLPLTPPPPLPLPLPIARRRSQRLLQQAIKRSARVAICDRRASGGHTRHAHGRTRGKMRVHARCSSSRARTDCAIPCGCARRSRTYLSARQRCGHR